MFTKRHYEKIADILNDARKEDYETVHYVIMERMISLFQEDNPKFDEDTFHIACGAESIVLWKYGITSLDALPSAQFQAKTRLMESLQNGP